MRLNNQDIDCEIKQLVTDIIPNLRFKFPYSVDDYTENLYMENYHCHKDFSNISTPDSAEQIENYAEQSILFKSKCLFSGEHGNQGNQFKVYKCAEQYGLKYRHSCEAYWVKDRHQNDRTNCHIVLVAKNEEGRKDINYALSMANIDGYYYKPRIDIELLLDIPPDNAIVTTACVAGWLYEDADNVWLKIAKHFKNNFFLEVQYHNTDKQKNINKHILDLSSKHNIQIICGLDSHYVKEENNKKRDGILEYKKIKYEDEHGWYLDYPDTREVIRRFREQGILSDEEILTSIMNTNIFVDECSEIVLDKHFKIPNIYKDLNYQQRCKLFKKKLNVAYSKEKFKSEDKKKGIVYEANEVMDSQVVDYFLLNEKLLKLAVDKYGGIFTTTSRGSASSFVINKLLGLTTIDRLTSEIPIFPERFLTKERVLAGQMPDIDLNLFHQEPFVKASRELLGEQGCYPLMAVEVLKEKNAWQLYAKLNDVSPTTANQISKYIDRYNKDLQHSDEEDKQYINIEDYIPQEYLNIYLQSKSYQQIVMNLKVHACGHLLFDGDIRREIGLISAVSETTGKRTICACVEGIYLDEFGYVKNDYLIVDSVGLTAELFQKIGKPVPSFDELREMIKNDKPTWEIYEKGITVCVNQIEKEATKKKCKKYKPQNLEELSAFIAGIRPGFKSLLPIFLDRKPYSTGEPVIDELLKDSYHFMLYQESIMNVLSYLGIEMGETYKIIKSISKKKLKGQKLKDLQNKLKKNWLDKIGNLDNFDKVWSVIQDSARYAFNAPHALSMGGDSAYQAWFKAHHTEIFYEVAINHYQVKNNKDKINALVDELITFYGYSLGNYKFGADNRKANLDSEKKIIYPNLSVVKGFGEKVVCSLYELGNREYKDFIELLRTLKSAKGISEPIIRKLISIDYFSDYGDINYLLKLYDILEWIDNRTQFKKSELTEEQILIFEKYGKTTEKQIKIEDKQGLLEEIISKTKVKETDFNTKIKYQFDVLGIVNLINPDSPINRYFVLNADVGKSITNISLYEIKTGQIREVKMWSSSFNKSPLAVKDIIKISVDKKNKKEPTDEINPKTGKKIWRDVPDKFEYWLKNYVMIGETLNTI